MQKKIGTDTFTVTRFPPEFKAELRHEDDLFRARSRVFCALRSAFPEVTPDEAFRYAREAIAQCDGLGRCIVYAETLQNQALPIRNGMFYRIYVVQTESLVCGRDISKMTWLCEVNV